MLLLDILKIKIPQLDQKQIKLHLAVWNGIEDPLDVFLDGYFQTWQEYQTKKNFERKYILSFISLHNQDKWLFAGIYESNNCEFHDGVHQYKYSTTLLSETEDLIGRLVVDFKRPGRQSYLNFENWFEKCFVSEMRQKKLTVSDFSGYNNTCISKSTLDLIVKNEIESWKVALSNVAGVYLITDTLTGKLYVGSATSENGIWQRWKQYSLNGHGGNKELIKVLKEKGEDYCKHFQYTILEIADTHTSSEEICEREKYWKNVFCSRQYGYNSN